MLLRRMLWSISDFFYYKVFGGNRIQRELKQRKTLVIQNLLSLFDEDEPHVIEGMWSWYKSSNGEYVPITLVFPELPIAVQVFHPSVAPWSEARIYSRDKKTWEIANRSANELKILCNAEDIPLLEIYWDDSIDTITLSRKIGPLLPKQELI